MENETMNEAVTLEKKFHMLNADFGYTITSVFMTFIYVFTLILA